MHGAKDEYLEIVGKNCRYLTVLKISGNFSDHGTKWIVPTIEGEDNEICNNINNGCDVLSHGCPDLTELDMDIVDKKNLLKFFKKLKSY